jgi:hypothetical protein
MYKHGEHMPRRAAILLLGLIAATIPVFGQGQSMDEALNLYKGKVLVLRHPIEGGTQRYDAGGNLLGQPAAGSWTAYSGVLIESVTLAPDKLAIQGRRMLFLFNHGVVAADYKEMKNHKLEPYPPKVKLEVQLDHALDSAQQVQALMGRLFALNTEDLIESLPDLWSRSVRDRLLYDPSLPWDSEFSWHEPKDRKFSATLDGEAIEHVGSA